MTARKAKEYVTDSEFFVSSQETNLYPLTNFIFIIDNLFTIFHLEFEFYANFDTST